ncbi:MAG: helix-turn-helix transcriptional regulator [Clostridia bacterium]|nr:helix-turn-helix transcriptional regulator [Clostridia bacterium]
MNIHSRLSDLLKQSGISRYRLAKICDIPEETLTGIFKRGNTPTLATLETICKGLGITLSQFFAENDMIEMSSDMKEFYEEWKLLTNEQKNLTIQVMKQMRSK